MYSDIPKLMENRKIDSLIVEGNMQFPNDASWKYILRGNPLDQGIVIWNQGERPILVASEEFSGDAAKKAAQAMNGEFVPSSRFKELLLELEEKEPNRFMRLIKYYLEIYKQLGVKGRISFHGAITAQAGYYFYRILERDMRTQDGSKIEIVPEPLAYENSLLEEARMTKDEREINLIKNAGKRAGEVFDEVVKYLQEKELKNGKVWDGNKEVTIGGIKNLISTECLKRGLSDASEPTIFSMGKESAQFHNTGSENVQLREGQTIIMDLFPRDIKSGYFWDQTRTYVIGSSSPKIKKAYLDVLEIQEEMIHFLKPGIPITEVGKKADELMEKRGYATYRSPVNKKGFREGFGHNIGHGIGLDIHEHPFLKSKGIPGELKVGMVFTIEPGVYFPYEKEPYGIRIEDVVVMREHGAENLTKYPKDWKSVVIEI